MRSTAAIIAVCSVVAAASYVRSTGAAGARWDAAPAARYLDSRMELWWTNAKVLQTGDSQARCISCHTAVPYALARPALRRALGETTPTPHEARILETAQRRVQRESERVEEPDAPDSSVVGPAKGSAGRRER